MQEEVKELEQKFNVDMEEFMDLFKRKFPREEIAERLGLSQHAVRKIGHVLRLKWKKSARADSYVKYVVELGASEDNTAELADIPVKENKYLTKKLKVATRALQHSRDEANHLRKQVRDGVRADSFEDRVLDIIENALPMKQKTTVKIEAPLPMPKYENYVSSILLSDLHVEETVVKADVGQTNEYNWKVMEDRLDRFFQEWFDSYRGESRAVAFILGDVISGIIHDTLESTSKPTAEAVHDLADLLHDYFSGAAAIFEKLEIHFCSGNHERISERIKSNSKGFDFGYLFAQILKAKLSAQSNVEMYISTTGYVAAKVGDKWAGGHHGDMHRGTKSDTRTYNIQEAFKNVMGVEVYHIFEGHSHKFSWHNQ